MDASEEHQGGTEGQDQTGDPGGDAEGFLKCGGDGMGLHHIADAEGGDGAEQGEQNSQPFHAEAAFDIIHWTAGHLDRKSTRLNSSHVKISYAVFCLKKKKNQ